MGLCDEDESRRLGVVVGDVIEVLEAGKWHSAKVVSIVKSGAEVLVHFKGWSSKWDKNVELCSPNVRQVF